MTNADKNLKYKGYKHRLYPTEDQETFINKTIGCSRYVFNHFRALWESEYKATGKSLSYKSCANALPVLKEELPWLREVDAVSLQKSIRNLADAYARFFNKQSKYPRFKSKKNPVQKYTTMIQGKNQVPVNMIDGNHIKIPKLGWVRFKNSCKVEGRITSATITHKTSGKYFVSLKVEQHIKPKKKTKSAVGIDLGITDFAILSTGRKIDNNRFTRTMEKKFTREQRKLARRGLEAKRRNIPLHQAKNYQKQKIKVARLHEQVANQRLDFLHKLSTDIIKNHDVICIEDLNARGMLRNRKLSKAVSDVSWSEFVRQLKYKAEWYGKTVIKIDRFFPSSQNCSNCGHTDGKKPLHIRQWTCPICITVHDRDLNAAQNILTEGLKQTTVGTMGLA